MDKIVREKATVSQCINQSSINQGLIDTNLLQQMATPHGFTSIRYSFSVLSFSRFLEFFDDTF